MDESRLFIPLNIGNIEIKNRIGMAGVSRFRADDQHVPTDLMKEYYCQRASVPGTLLITEPNLISKRTVSLRNAPGLFTREQTAAWKTIVEEVHMRSSYIFAQLCVLKHEMLGKEAIIVRGPSTISLDTNFHTTKAMTIEEIKGTVQDFVRAAKNAAEAGFDGVELLGATGDLIDAFSQEDTNQRDDEYGGSVENRSRFLHEVMKAVAHAIGIKRVGLCLSSRSTSQDVRVKEKAALQFTDVIRRADDLKIAYIHLTEPHIAESNGIRNNEWLDFACTAFRGPILVQGGYNSNLARKLVDERHPDKDIVVMFGRYFTSNPDLVFRIQHDLEFTPYSQQDLFATKSFKGYTNYAFSKEYLGSLNMLTQLLC
ncbi:NADPH dehydrogenase [Trichoderma harzianum]|uniref:NADPH dehydrogenase n=1 Tax=Trichoderma harzianum TaxID=5544 RepID=A0A0F9XQ41_TRIHA|nr:NADPH dehydrogenase [Trichoderma harzianum]